MIDNPIILGIESSCDDTSAAIYFDGKVLSNVTSSQTIHKKFGGVVPEMASRLHQQYIIPVVNEAIAAAGIRKKNIHAVAFTRGPGLMGSLLVGVSFAKAFALAMEIPLIEVNHMQAHVLAHFIEAPKPKFPFLCLTVSGGHTQIVLVRDYLDMAIIGKTTDDAAGEAFDKAAKMLGLPYPGGPEIDRLAARGNPEAFSFACPDMPGLDFSYSGFKTSVLYFLQKAQAKDPGFIQKNLPDLCASIQQSIIGQLMNKLEQASRETGITEIAIAGGVSANSGLRQAVEEHGKTLDWKTFIPKFEYCTDNAAMIAITGYFKYRKAMFVGQDVSPMARWPVQ